MARAVATGADSALDYFERGQWCHVHGRPLIYVAYPDESMAGEWFCEECEAHG